MVKAWWLAGCLAPFPAMASVCQHLDLESSKGSDWNFAGPGVNWLPRLLAVVRRARSRDHAALFCRQGGIVIRGGWQIRFSVLVSYCDACIGVFVHSRKQFFDLLHALMQRLDAGVIQAPMQDLGRLKPPEKNAKCGG